MNRFIPRVLGARLVLVMFGACGALGSFTGFAVSPALGACGDTTVDAGEDCDDGDAAFAFGEECDAECVMTPCGKPTGSAGLTPIASDALFVLRSAVGSAACADCVCDVDATGSTTASDALKVLRTAVGQPLDFACQACFAVARKGHLVVGQVIDVPEGDRDDIQAHRGDIEGDGLELAADGSQISWPQIPAAGWPVTFGDRTFFTNENGEVLVDVVAGDSTVGTIAHPQQPDTPLFEVALGHLAPLSDTPQDLVFEIDFEGPCGMNDDPSEPDPDACSELTADLALEQMLAARGDAHEHHGHGHAHAGDDETAGGTMLDPSGAELPRSQTDPATAQTQGALGSYPAGNQHCCRDFDGGTFDGTTTLGVLLNYSGSTCDKLVSDGCCAGELGSIKNSILAAVGALTPKDCRANHKGRYCQEVKQGDLAVQVPTSLATPTVAVTQPVNLGDRVTVTAHNNGCFGETSVEKTEDQLNGVLTGTNLSGKTLKHYSAPKTYVTDQPLTYAVAHCVGGLTGTEKDKYTFSADGKTVTVAFAINTTNLWRFFPNGPIFSAVNHPVSGPDLCDGNHVHGLHPCNGAADPNPGSCGHGKVAPYTPGS